MTNIKLLLFFLIIQIVNLQAQDNQVIQACVDKTTMLVFDSNIIHVDLGVNSGIAYQLDTSIPNILKLKIASSFSQTDTTNLLVITENDLVFAFDVIYKTDIVKYVYLIADSMAVNKKNLKSLKITADLFEKQIHDKIMSDTFLPRIPYCKRGRIILSLENIFTDSKKLYLRCKLENTSSIQYNINFMNFFQTTEKANKAVSDQDITIPLSAPEIKRIAPHASELFVLSCDKFTLENNRMAILEIYEKDGGRHLKIRLTNDLILRAVLLDEKNTSIKKIDSWLCSGIYKIILIFASENVL